MRLPESEADVNTAAELRIQVALIGARASAKGCKVADLLATLTIAIGGKDGQLTTLLFDLKNLKDGPGGIQSDMREIVLGVLRYERATVGGMIFPLAPRAPFRREMGLADQSLALHAAKEGIHPLGPVAGALTRRAPRFMRNLDRLKRLTGIMSLAAASKEVTLDPISFQLNDGIFDWLFAVDVDRRWIELLAETKYYLATQPWRDIELAAHFTRRGSGGVIRLPDDCVMILASPLHLRPSNGLPYFVRWHDAIPLRSVGWESRLDAEIFDAAMRNAPPNATFLCDSRASMEDLELFYPQLTGRGIVMYCPVEPLKVAQSQLIENLAAEYGLKRGHYIASVGSESPRKNFSLLIDIYEKVRRAIPDVKLLIIGRQYIPSEQVRDRISHLGKAVVEVQGLERSVLASLLAGAAVYVSTSIYEGFGKGLVEAQSAGVPVVAPSTPVFREVLGASANLFDRFDAEEAAAMCLRILRDPGLSDQLSKSGMLNAQRFHPKVIAHQLLDIVASRVPYAVTRGRG